MLRENDDSATLRARFTVIFNDFVTIIWVIVGFYTFLQ
jgi:hypothetical protein